jgi:hypothetical protein
VIPNTGLLAVLSDNGSQVEDGTYKGDSIWRADVPFDLLIERKVR